jgi:hypothetical protein
MLSDARNTKVLTATSNAYLRGVRATVCVCCLWRGRVGRRKRRGDFTWNRQGVRVCGGVMGHIEKKRITSARILLGKGKCEERERPPSPSPSPSPSVSVSPSPAPAPSPPVRLFNEPVRPDSPLHCVRMIGASPLLLLRPLLCSNRTHAQPNENATFALSLPAHVTHTPTPWRTFSPTTIGHLDYAFLPPLHTHLSSRNTKRASTGQSTRSRSAEEVSALRSTLPNHACVCLWQLHRVCPLVL